MPSNVSPTITVSGAALPGEPLSKAAGTDAVKNELHRQGRQKHPCHTRDDVQACNAEKPLESACNQQEKERDGHDRQHGNDDNEFEDDASAGICRQENAHPHGPWAGD